MEKYFQFGLMLIVSWIVMTLTHESGHIVGGWLGGATLIKCDLLPWHLPYSLHQPDPHPLVTLWAGPILGIAIPYAVAAVIRSRWALFVANFCLLANGCYLALAWWSGERFLDTPRLLDAGASRISIAIYCLVTIGCGYAWFRQDCQLMLFGSNEPSQKPVEHHGRNQK